MRIKLSNSVPAVGLEHQTPGDSSRWGAHEFIINQPSAQADAWAVIDGLPAAETTHCPADKTILFACEAPAYKSYHRRWMNTFAHVVSCAGGFSHPSSHLAPPPLIWLVGRTYTQLQQESPAKSHLLSTVCSRKTTIAGHRRRLAFLESFKEKFPFDWYGRGSQEIPTKWDGLAPYRYSIALENSSHPRYWTEKIADCFLAETVPLYWGCPDIASYFPPDSYIRIDLDTAPEKIHRLRQTLSEEDYQRRLPALREAKRLCLDYYNAMPTVARFVEALSPRAATAAKTIPLKPEPQPNYLQRKLTKLWRKLPFGS